MDFDVVVEDEVTDASDQFKTLLKKIFSKDPTQRPTFDDILAD